MFYLLWNIVIHIKQLTFIVLVKNDMELFWIIQDNKIAIGVQILVWINLLISDNIFKYFQILLLSNIIPKGL